MSFHSEATGKSVHVINAFTFADATARNAAVVIAADIGKVAKQSDNNTYYILIDTTPTWAQIDSGGFDTFLELTDTPSSYSGQAGKVTQVNAGATAVEFGQQLRTTDSPQFIDLILTGDLTVQGTTTTIDTTTLLIKDKNIELGVVATPTDVTADGGGITLKGTTDKTIIWINATDSWQFNQDIFTSGHATIGALTAPPTDVSLNLAESDKAFLPNQGTTAQRDALTPTEGMQYYNLDNNDLEFYNGTAWQSMSGGDVVGPASSTDNAITRFNGITGKNIQNSLATLSDTGVLALPDGTAALPAYTFSSDTNTGMYLPLTDVLGFAVGGFKVLEINAAPGSVNSMILTGALTGVGPSILATGSDTNVDLDLFTKGTGKIGLGSDVNVTGRIAASDGIAALPAYTFTSDTSSGLFLASSNNPEITANGFAVLRMSGVFEGKNHIRISNEIKNSSGGLGPSITIDGIDTNIDLRISAKASGFVTILSGLKSSVSIHNADGTAASPSYTFTADTNTGMYRDIADRIGFSAQGANVLRLTNALASAVNFIEMSGAVTGFHPSIIAEGSDTNIDLDLFAKGTGSIKLVDPLLSTSTGEFTQLNVGVTSPTKEISAFGTIRSQNAASSPTRTIDIIAAVGAIDCVGATLSLNRFSSNAVSIASGGGNVGIKTATPASTFEIEGTFGMPPLFGFGSIDTDQDHSVYAADSVGGVTTYIIKTAHIVDGRIFIFYDETGNADTNNITILTEGSQLISGQTNFIIAADFGWVKMIARAGKLTIIG